MVVTNRPSRCTGMPVDAHRCTTDAGSPRNSDICFQPLSTSGCGLEADLVEEAGGVDGSFVGDACLDEARFDERLSEGTGLDTTLLMWMHIRCQNTSFGYTEFTHGVVMGGP